jgi:hypothetical protein
VRKLGVLAILGAALVVSVAPSAVGGGNGMSTTIGAGGPGTGQQYCDDAPEPRFPFFLDRGNLQVRS